MQTIPRLDPKQAGEASKELFDAIRKQMGGVPNIFSTMGHSPAVLKGYLGFSAALAEGELSAQLREQIALACAGANACDYCASAHSALGKMAGLNPEELTLNLGGRASDPQVDVVLKFVRKVVIQRARLDADDVSALRKAGLGDAHIVEVIGQIAVNLFTNYFNHVANTDVDFPIVRTEVALAA